MRSVAPNSWIWLLYIYLNQRIFSSHFGSIYAWCTHTPYKGYVTMATQISSSDRSFHVVHAEGHLIQFNGFGRNIKCYFPSYNNARKLMSILNSYIVTIIVHGMYNYTYICLLDSVNSVQCSDTLWITTWMTDKIFINIKII